MRPALTVSTLKRWLPLLACLLCLPALAAQRVVVANLQLPASVWPAQQEAVVGLLSEAAPAVVIIQGVSTSDPAGPAVCQLARQLRMHCDFVTADPPSAAIRHGSVLMSQLAIEEDGAGLLHGGDVAPLAAGYLRLRLGGRAVAIYSASLTPGAAHAGTRARQAADLRRWMHSHGHADAIVVCARFASTPVQLRQLMPGYSTVRRPGAADLPHGVDVLYRPDQARLVSATVLRLQSPGAAGGPPPAAPPATELIGVVVELELDIDPPRPG